MKQPVSYLQTDARWASNDYSAPGEKTTIGASGCGPTAMSMVIATWADSKVTPATECAWAKAHGYKAKGQGTYYAYFPPAGKRYGLTVTQLNGGSIYGNPASVYHAQAKAAIDTGNLVIACMGPGNWTSSGHFVLVYDIQGNTIYINDPASTKTARTKGDYSLFKKQVKYYFVIKKPANVKEDDDMDQATFNKMFDTAMATYRGHLRDNDSAAYSEDARKYAIEHGIFTGSGTLANGDPNYMWEDFITREQAATILYRFAQDNGLVKK